MELLAASIYSYRSGYMDALERSLALRGVEFLPYKDPFFSWRRRLLWEWSVCKVNPDRLMVFLDPWDSLMIGSNEELLSLGLERGITFGADTACWPDADRVGAYAKKQGREKSPWRYVNPSPLVGRGSTIADAIEWGWKRFPLLGDSKRFYCANGTDQRFWHTMYLDGPKKFGLRIDTECRLAQLAAGSKRGDFAFMNGRLINNFHTTRPIFLHANCRTPIPKCLLP